MRAAENRSLAVAWKKGAESARRYRGHLMRYAVFALLRCGDDLFRSVKAGTWGWCVHWSEDIEIAADTPRRWALQQGAAALRGWRLAREISESEAARALGLSPRAWKSFEAGERLLPRTARLACLGFDARHEAA